MSAAQFFSDRDALLSTASLALQGLVSWSDINDKLSQRHLDTVFVVVCTHDNGCPEDYNQYDVGMFRAHEDASFVLTSLIKENSEADAYHIEVRRIY